MFAKTLSCRPAAHGLHTFFSVLLLLAMLAADLGPAIAAPPLVSLPAPPSIVAPAQPNSPLLSPTSTNTDTKTNNPQPQPLPAPGLADVAEAFFTPDETQKNTLPAVDLRRLPADLTELEELVEQRTATSATFKKDSETYVSILSMQPMHYQDNNGVWQVIDARFQTWSDSFLVERSALKTRANQMVARLSAAAGETALVWEAQRLDLLDGARRVIPLAHSQFAGAVPGMPNGGLQDNAQTVRYTAGWSQTTLADEIISRPNEVEYSLVFIERPEYAGWAEHLEMTARLRLLPGHTLWANGRQQNTAFYTAGSLEVRGKADETLVLQPVRAYEQQDPDVSISGEYWVEPAGPAGEWTVRIRTAWHWWNHPSRRYPAVLDPTITVKFPTPAPANSQPMMLGAFSVAKINPVSGPTHFSEFCSDGTYWHDHCITLGDDRTSDDLRMKTRGYFQFNSLPSWINSVPVDVYDASIEVTPGAVFLPDFPWDSDDYVSYGLMAKTAVIQRNTTLRYVGACPHDAACSGFSLTDDKYTTFNWESSPIGQDVQVNATQPLVAGRLDGTGQGKTTWDVTAEFQAWYSQWKSKGVVPYALKAGPLFSLAFPDTEVCPYQSVIPGFMDDDPKWPGALPCTAVHVPGENVHLILKYRAPTIQPGTYLNKPGVPSQKDLFFEGEVVHRYELADYGGASHWRAVAVRGDADVEPSGEPAWIGLRLRMAGAFSSIDLSSVVPTTLTETTFLLIDDQAGLTQGQVLHADIPPDERNRYQQDDQRNYRLTYARADTTLVHQYSNVVDGSFHMASDYLITLAEIHLNAGDNFSFSTKQIVLPHLPDSASQVYLIAPSKATSAKKAVLDLRSSKVMQGKRIANYSPHETPYPRVNTTFIVNNVPVSGKYAIVMVNPRLRQPQTGEFLEHVIDYSYLICTQEQIPTGKHGCQPLILPDTSVPLSRPVSNGKIAFKVYSEGGFTAETNWCTKNEQLGAPVIGPVQGRWLFVAQGSVCYIDGDFYTTGESGIGITVPKKNGDPNNLSGVVSPILYGQSDKFTYAEYEEGKVTLVGDALVPVDDTIRNVDLFQGDWKSVTQHVSEQISLSEMWYEAHDQINAQVALFVDENPKSINWDTTLHLYPPVDDGDPETLPYTVEFVRVEQSPALSVPEVIASMELRLMDDLDKVATGKFDTVDYIKTADGNPRVMQFKARARITQPATLGGATQKLKALVLPPGVVRLSKARNTCGPQISCFDLLSDDYTWDPDEGDGVIDEWKMPDIHIVTTPGSVVFSRPGSMQVFSNDHPDALAPAIAETMSFDTWGAAVHITEENCVEGDGQRVTVIRGTANISLPMIGGSGGGVQADFKLCESALRETKLTLSVPAPGVPIGSTGVGVYILGGTIDISPASTVIALNVAMESMDGKTYTDGEGKIIIDTAGMLTLQAAGTLVGALSLDELTLQIAWNPLDLLFRARASYAAGLISGGLEVHAWVGKGWQDRYYWIKDTKFHFTGQIDATLRIKSGAVIDKLFLVIPPWTISFTVNVQFGEFCANSDCSSYAWGISATFEVFGYDVGLYVGEDGFDIILGTNNHTLISQYGGGLVAAQMERAAESTASEVALAPQLDPPILPGSLQKYELGKVRSSTEGWEVQVGGCGAANKGKMHICMLTVEPGTGKAFFGAQWQNGNLQLVLKAPTGEMIDQGTEFNHAAFYGASQVFGEAGKGVGFSLYAQPGKTLPNGVWELRILNIGLGLDEGFAHNYAVMFAADPPAPRLTWTSVLKAGLTPAADGMLPITWKVTRGGAPLTEADKGLRMELFYTPVATKPITPTWMIGNLIAAEVDPQTGNIAWDTRFLASGEYAVGARLQDHFRGNGSIVLWAPGSVVINDQTPPPAPIPVEPPMETGNGLLVSWLVDKTTPDLAGYLVDYLIPTWENKPGVGIERTLRVVPGRRDAGPGAAGFEQVLLGGLLEGWQTQICIKAYDASGNVSRCNPINDALTGESDSQTGSPTVVGVTPGDDGDVQISWSNPSYSGDGGTVITYRPVGCMIDDVQTVANEGPSPIRVPKTTTGYTLTGLTPGQVYEFTLTAFTVGGNLSRSVKRSVMLINETDANIDGLPDQWASIFGVAGPAEDPDQDGLDNAGEYKKASFPKHADSDGDRHYDGVEALKYTNVCDATIHPEAFENSQLEISNPGPITIRVPKNEETGASEKEQVSISNTGGGELCWTLLVSAPWIKTDKTKGCSPEGFEVWVDVSDLEVGHHTGSVTVISGKYADGSNIVEKYEIPIEVFVLPEKQPTTYFYLYHPLLNRR